MSPKTKFEKKANRKLSNWCPISSRMCQICGLPVMIADRGPLIVAAEFVAAKQGIGYLIWLSWSTLSVGEMYAGLVVIAMLGLLFTTGLERLGKRLMPWAEEFRVQSK